MRLIIKTQRFAHTKWLKLRLKFTLEQAMKALEENRSIALLFL